MSEFSRLDLAPPQDIITYYEQKYQESLGLLKLLGEGKDRRDAFRSGLNRIPVT